MKKAVKKMEKKAKQQYKNQNTQADVKVGETIIDKKPNLNQQGNKSVGEYIDFEEID